MADLEIKIKESEPKENKDAIPITEEIGENKKELYKPVLAFPS